MNNSKVGNTTSGKAVLFSVHKQHLMAEGFQEADLGWVLHQGVRSISEEEARQLGLTYGGKGVAGLYFPFSKEFGQVRADEAPWSHRNGHPRQAKYISQHGKGVSRVWTPDLNNGSKLELQAPYRVLTEGWKDAAQGTLYGRIETLAIAGVSHWKGAVLERDLHVDVILYDSDAKANPQVLLQLIRAGKALGCRIQFVPEVPEVPKAGVGDWIRWMRQCGRSEEDIRKIYAGLVADAVKPEELLKALPGIVPNYDNYELILRIAYLEFGTALYERIKRRLIDGGFIKERTAKEWLSRLNTLLFRRKHGASYQAGAHPPAHYAVERFFKGGPSKSDYLVIDGSWRHWNAELGYWESMPETEVHRRLQVFLNRYWTITARSGFCHPFQTDTAFKQSIAVAQRLLTKQELTKLRFIAFKNGTLDCLTREFRAEHKREDFCTRRIDVEYRADVHECPEVLKQFISQSYGEDMLPVVRMLIWWLIDPTAPYGKFLMLVGASGSGKGVLSRFLEELLPEELVTSPTNPMDLNDQDKRHQILGGKQLCTFKDLAGTYLRGLGGFYELVDNGMVSGRALHSSTAYSIYWNCRFILGATQHLSVENANEGWKRRCFTLPTLSKAPENPDRSLGEKLAQCRGDAIAWALSMPREEAIAIYEQPQRFSERMAEAELEAEASADSVSQFADECLSFEQEHSMPTADLFLCFRAYCRMMGIRSEMTRKSFTQRLKSHLDPGIQDPIRRNVQTPTGTIRAHHFQHIKPLPELFRLPTATDSDTAEATCNPDKIGYGGIREIRQGFARLKSPKSPPQASEQSDPQDRIPVTRPDDLIDSGIRSSQSPVADRGGPDCPDCPDRSPARARTKKVEPESVEKVSSSLRGKNQVNQVNQVNTCVEQRSPVTANSSESGHGLESGHDQLGRPLQVGDRVRFQATGTYTTKEYTPDGFLEGTIRGFRQFESQPWAEVVCLTPKGKRQFAVTSACSRLIRLS